MNEVRASSICFGILCLLLLLESSFVAAADIPVIPIPFSGNASLTHYDLPLGGYVASCGCGSNSTYYPTAAINQAVYGSSISAGQSCGQCFNLTLVSPFLSFPPYVLPPSSRPSIVVKITDKCPAPALYDPDKTWCGSTATQPNHGVYVHFDLSSPSPSIPLSFFPPPPPSYGYDDFGSWLIQFERVSCTAWSGYTNSTASIVDPSLGTIANTGCCPVDPFGNNSTTCNNTSLRVGGPSSASSINHSLFIYLPAVLSFFHLITFL